MKTMNTSVNTFPRSCASEFSFICPAAQSSLCLTLWLLCNCWFIFTKFSCRVFSLAKLNLLLSDCRQIKEVRTNKEVYRENPEQMKVDISAHTEHFLDSFLFNIWHVTNLYCNLMWLTESVKRCKNPAYLISL